MNFLKFTYKKVFHFFDKVEDVVRGRLSKYPIMYAVIAGVLVVLFWRGIWHTGDLLEQKGGFLGFLFSGPISLILSTVFLLLTGVFVSEFVGEMLILSGLKKEKKLVDKTEDEIIQEKKEIESIDQTILHMVKEIDELENNQKVLVEKIDEQNKILKKLLDK